MTNLTIPSHTDPMVDERIVIDAAIWRGIRNAIIPSLLCWGAFIALGMYLASLS